MRIAKREFAVATTKSLINYKLYSGLLRHDERADDDPQTPNAHDLSIPKRLWERSVQEWRLQLKNRCDRGEQLMSNDASLCETYIYLPK
eukprot:4378758-Heterocapsa_arctica.AAC.1